MGTFKPREIVVSEIRATGAVYVEKPLNVQDIWCRPPYVCAGGRALCASSCWVHAASVGSGVRARDGGVYPPNEGESKKLSKSKKTNSDQVHDLLGTATMMPARKTTLISISDTENLPAGPSVYSFRKNLS